VQHCNGIHEGPNPPFLSAKTHRHPGIAALQCGGAPANEAVMGQKAHMQRWQRWQCCLAPDS